MSTLNFTCTWEMHIMRGNVKNGKEDNMKCYIYAVDLGDRNKISTLYSMNVTRDNFLN